MVAPTNVRFPESVDKGLAAYARQAGAKKSTVVVSAVREWLRMQAHSGVVFVATMGGDRRAALSAGPQVWTVAEAWLQHDKDERSAAVVAEALGLEAADVENALAYWADFPDEIDDLISRHRASQDEALAAWERRRVPTAEMAQGLRLRRQPAHLRRQDPRNRHRLLPARAHPGTAGRRQLGAMCCSQASAGLSGRIRTWPCS